jgi:hypothetical protein
MNPSFWVTEIEVDVQVLKLTAKFGEDGKNVPFIPPAPTHSRSTHTPQLNSAFKKSRKTRIKRIKRMQCIPATAKV